MITPVMRPRRVLLAEDDDEMRDMLRTALVICGYEVTECRDGVELVDRLNDLFNPEWQRTDQRWDLVVSDVRMPRLDGLSILNSVTDYVGFPPILLITAFGDAELEQSATAMGAAGVMNKPFDMNQFIALVHALTPA